MGLNMKTFKQILNNMANWISVRNPKLNNFYVGSVIRTLLESVATEVEALYFQMYKGFKYAIENSIFHSFGFYKYPAVPASGGVILIFKMPLPQDLAIPKGYRLSTLPSASNPIYFETIDDIVFPKGATSGTVQVQCTEPGVVGNVAAYAIRILVIPIAVIQQAYNPEAFSNGRAEETTEDRKKRFTRYITTLARGTVSAVQYGCLRVPGVTGAYVEDTPGLIKVYVHDASGNLSEELKELVYQSLLEYRPAGMELVVLPVIKRPVNITVHVTIQKGFDSTKYVEAIATSVTAFLNYFTVSRTLTKAELITFIMSIDTAAIVNAYTDLENDVAVANNELIRAGTITVYSE